MTNTPLCDRRRPDVPDRRRSSRGGRRASDLLRCAAWAAFVTFISASAAAAQTPQPQGWTTSGTKILAPGGVGVAGVEFVISGINWYGFETRDRVAHGLWTKDYKYILNQVQQYGYNTVRIPFSNDMWERNPIPNNVSACPECKGKTARDILALIVNYAGSLGLHVILDNHRSTAGNSAQENGLWYARGYPEQSWIRDWVSVQAWVHGIPQSLGAPDTIPVQYLAADGFPTVLGYDLRNEPHTPSRKAYSAGATWGSGDGIDPAVNPNPNPFTPVCIASSACHDWRLAAERAGDTILGEAANNGWAYPLIFVEGLGLTPADGGSHAAGPYDGYWWGGNLKGVNGNSTTPGAPIVLNAGEDATDATGLGPAVYNQLVYSAHDYGPSLYRQSWFNSSTCYQSGCSSSSLVDVWTRYWAHLNIPGGVSPIWPGSPSYPWGNTRHDIAYVQTQSPLFIGEFGTANADSDLSSSVAGSQGQWNTDLINFIQSSYLPDTSLNYSGFRVTDLHWTYWALNDEDGYALLGANYAGLENPKKQYSFLCFIQGLLAVGEGCGSTGPLPDPH